MSDLQQAINALAEARPDPAKVEALTAETLKRQEMPYAAADAWGSSKILADNEKVLVCMICRLPVHIIPYGHYNRPFPFPEQHEDLNTHLEWHNSIERRLRKLEAA